MTTTTRATTSDEQRSNGSSQTKDAAAETPAVEQHPGARKTYEDAVANGFYQRDSGGLAGKFDNVRRFWEDQITRYALHDFVGPLVDWKRRQLSRIRVLDLGAGSGEGYEILHSLKVQGASLASKEVDVLPPEIFGYYKGVDISPAMVEQGQQFYQGDPKVEFVVGDLSQGLGEAKKDHGYDIYFSSYGSLSHLRDGEMEQLLEDLFDHFEGSCVFVADLLGRFSFEWQCYWSDSGTDEVNMRQYSMSYLYPREMLGKIEVERFPVRYWNAEEFNDFVKRVVSRRGGRIAKSRLWDRSVLVGRHMNTGEFNRHAQPIRRAVNSLHEFNQRTDLETLIFDYTPHADFPKLNDFFEQYQMAWNAVVYAAIQALEHWNDREWLEQDPPEIYPAPVNEAIRTIRNVVGNCQWFRMGDPRANVIEPQLGYVLRNLEMDLQKGIGAGHGLLAIYELTKD